MIILPIKSRLQIVKERDNPKDVWTGRYVILVHWKLYVIRVIYGCQTE